MRIVMKARRMAKMMTGTAVVAGEASDSQPEGP